MSHRHLVLAACLAAGCSSSSPGAADGAGPAPQPDGGTATGDGAASCKVELAMPADEGANHVAECAPVTYGSRPPSSGNHYGRWAVFKVYSKPVPWGYLVHAMEHGAVVIAYNCPTGCAADVARATALVESTPPKAACSRPPVILVPDPTLDVTWAAAAWHNTLRAPCYDEDALKTFITAHRDRGPELFAEDCGIVDLEARDWCANGAPPP
jgi:hypothetical protein